MNREIQGVVLAWQCQVHSLVNLFGLLSMEFVIHWPWFCCFKKKERVEWHSGCIRNINCKTGDRLIRERSRRVVCNADFLETRSGE